MVVVVCLPGAHEQAKVGRVGVVQVLVEVSFTCCRVDETVMAA